MLLNYIRSLTGRSQNYGLNGRIAIILVPVGKGSLKVLVPMSSFTRGKAPLADGAYQSTGHETG